MMMAAQLPCRRLPVQSGIIRKALAVPLATRIQATLDVTEALVLESLDQLEKIHQQVLQKENIIGFRDINSDVRH